MRRGATHRRVERRRANRNGERQAPSADAVRARTAANLRTAFRPPPLQRLARRRSPHTRQTPFQREPLRTCERHSAASAATFVAPAFAAYARRRAAGHVTEHETVRGRRRRRQARRGRSPFSCRRPLDRATSRRERRSTPTTTTKSAANAPRRFTRSEPTGESASRRSMQPAPHRTASQKTGNVPPFSMRGRPARARRRASRPMDPHGAASRTPPAWRAASSPPAARHCAPNLSVSPMRMTHRHSLHSIQFPTGRRNDAFRLSPRGSHQRSRARPSRAARPLPLFAATLTTCRKRKGSRPKA
ncbi:hypothetical protein Y046_2349 [Burkholderia pseudomallei MSHR2990]|nr:hypothetical protein Y046_2349 [Burkholderia pseudomallei MSHR2990]